jgi:hypothetical protein
LLTLICIATNNIDNTGIENPLKLGEQEDVVELQRQGRTVEEVCQEVSQMVISLPERHPYELLSETPTEVLQREYMIYEAGIVGGTAFEIHPFNELTAIGLTAGKVFRKYSQTFRYFRSDVKLRFMNNCTPCDYGVYTISWVPNMDAMDSGWALFNLDPIIVDLSTQQQVEVVIPWTEVSEWYLVGDLIAAAPPKRGPMVHVHVISRQTINSSSVPNLKVYGSFLNPELAGSAAITAEAQSGALVKLSEISSVQASPLTMATVGGVSTALTLATGSTMLVNAAYTANSLYQFSQATSQYQEEASRWYHQGRKTEETKQNEEPIAVRNQAYGNLAGCVYGPSLQLGSHINEFVAPFHLGDNQFRHKVLDIAKTPAITHAFNLNGDVDYLIRYEPLTNKGPGSVSLSYIDMMAPLFRFWRGSIKVRISLYASPLMSFEATIRWNNRNGTSTTIDDMDTMYKRVVQCRGTTHHDFLIPWIFTKPWLNLSQNLSTTDSYHTSTLTISVTNPCHTIGSNSASPFCLISVAAGDDFQFRSLRSPNAPRTAPVMAEAQMHLRSSFGGVFENISGSRGNPRPIRPVPEQDLSVEDICMRFSSIPVGIDITMMNPPSPPYNQDSFYYIVSLFRYQRGSRRLKRKIDGTVGDPYVTIENGHTSSALAGMPKFWAGDGASANLQAENGVLEWEMPFLSEYEWWITTYLNSASVFGALSYDFITNMAAENEQFIAGGADFQLAHLLCPFINYNYLPFRSGLSSETPVTDRRSAIVPNRYFVF